MADEPDSPQAICPYITGNVTRYCTLTRDERTMLWVMSVYVMIDALPKVGSFAARVWSWLN